MAYDATKYQAWRTLKVRHAMALALADSAAPQDTRIPVVVPAILDIPTPGSATAATCANKINEILVALRTAGYLHA